MGSRKGRRAGPRGPASRIPVSERGAHRGGGRGHPESRPVWRLDHAAGEWRRATQDPDWRLRPYELLLVDAANGGYDLETGFDPSSRHPVTGNPELAVAVPEI